MTREPSDQPQHSPTQPGGNYNLRATHFPGGFCGASGGGRCISLLAAELTFLVEEAGWWLWLGQAPGWLMEERRRLRWLHWTGGLEPLQLRPV